MLNKNKIKKLAIIAANESKIPEDIQEFVLKNLEKSELKQFLKIFKSEIDKKRVYITSAKQLSDENLKELRQMYKADELVTNLDNNLGAGLKLRKHDIIVDFTFKKYINDTIDELKN